MPRTGLVRMRQAVAAQTRRYRWTERSATYSRSWASFSAQEVSRVIRSWANPVRPGSTTRRCQYCGIWPHSSSKNAGRIGRGPTMLMSPRTTFQSCGSSSRWAKRSTRPRRVTSVCVRCVSSWPRYGPSRASASGVSVRNFSIVKMRPARPTRLPR